MTAVFIISGAVGILALIILFVGALDNDEKMMRVGAITAAIAGVSFVATLGAWNQVQNNQRNVDKFKKNCEVMGDKYYPRPEDDVLKLSNGSGFVITFDNRGNACVREK